MALEAAFTKNLFQFKYIIHSMKIFVLHYAKLVHRKKYIIEQFLSHSITDYEFIEIEHSEIKVHNIKEAESSLVFKHYYAYQLIAEKYDHALILEDDAFLTEGFMDKLNNYMSQLPQDYDMLYIGDGCKLHINKLSDANIYKKDLYPTSWGGNGATRCTDSYVIHKK